MSGVLLCSVGTTVLLLGPEVPKGGLLIFEDNVAVPNLQTMKFECVTKERFKLIYIEQYKSEILTGLTNPGLLGPLDFADKPSRYQPSSLNSCLSIVTRGLKSLKIQAGRFIERNIKYDVEAIFFTAL